MTVIRLKRLMAGAKKNICLALACLTAVCSGCGQGQAGEPLEDVELLEPVGVAMSYETAARRNLYSSSVYSAMVCPYLEEYQLDEGIVFAAYDSYPGDAVQQGSVLLHANVESYNDRIEALEESIADMDKSYQEFLQENDKSLNQAKENQRIYAQVVDNLEKIRPAESDPDYPAWYSGDKYAPGGYKRYSNNLLSANQSVLELEEARKQRTELYELDRAYNLLQIKRLKEDRSKGTLTSGMAGYVAAVQYYNEGDWVSGDLPLVGVCDPNKVELRSEYISKTEIRRAEDVYALINGKRYEVEYEEISNEEYQKIKDQNGVVYSTFHVLTDTEEIEMGAYAAIVVKKESRENVVTVPKDAIQRDGNIRYVYLVNGNESVYTVVSIGMNDGMYTEILSGVKEGDKVLTNQAVTAGEGTVTVTRGRMSNTFSDTGYFTYLSTKVITNPVEYGTCYFVEGLVSRYQQVQKGEVLARIRVVSDQLEISRNEQKLLRERERLEDLKKADEEGNEKIIEQKEKTIRDLEDLLADMKADAAVTEIKAPSSGIITSVPDMEEGDLLGRGARLYILADESQSYVIVDDPSKQLAYGNKAQISFTDREGNARTATGEVVTANRMSLSSQLVTNYALIRIPIEDLGNMAGSFLNANGWWNQRGFQVSVTIRCMDNVLLVPRGAVVESGGRTYVKIRLDSGEIQYRSFIAGGSDASNYWVVEGLTEGMELCLR